MFAFVSCATLACVYHGRQPAGDAVSARQSPGVETDASVDATTFKDPTETYVGIVNGVRVVFEHKDFTQFRLTDGTHITQGNLNTERGFQDDEDATLFILNFDKPENEQAYFVRLSNGRCIMLNGERKEIPGAYFEKQ